ncbi:MAG: hypothetical protein K2H61_07145, partial [Muribaculaceae bacterium]|nr:hypothetical protein [Muribaculaceae bacterium]
VKKQSKEFVFTLSCAAAKIHPVVRSWQATVFEALGAAQQRHLCQTADAVRGRRVKVAVESTLKVWTMLSKQRFLSYLTTAFLH